MMSVVRVKVCIIAYCSVCGMYLQLEGQERQASNMSDGYGQDMGIYTQTFFIVRS